MASKTVHAKKKTSSTKAASTKAANKSASTQTKEPKVTVKKSASCPTLSQTGTIGYEISVDDTGTTLFGLTSNSGTGYFSKVRVAFNDILAALKEFEKQFPLTSLAMKSVYPPSSSINNWSFMLAVLLAEGVVENHPDHPRRYRLCKEPDAFLASLGKLTAQHSAPAKGKPSAKRKATTSMKTPRKKPATGK